MTTEWVNRDDGGLEHPPKTKSKWTGLVMDPIASIYDKVIQDIETEYDTYAAAFANWTDKDTLNKGSPSVVEGFEYEIDNTPIYTSPEPEPEPEDEPEEPVKDETKPPPMSDEEKSNLMSSVYDIILRVITILGTLFVAYNLYYTMKKTGKHIDFYGLLSFMSFGPFYILTGAMLKTVGFFDNAMLNIIPYYLQLAINSTSVLRDRTLFLSLIHI
jgi:hypothetical protein